MLMSYLPGLSKAILKSNPFSVLFKTPLYVFLLLVVNSTTSAYALAAESPT